MLHFATIDFLVVSYLSFDTEIPSHKAFKKHFLFCLVGRIPESLGNCIHLKHLRLQNNMLSGLPNPEVGPSVLFKYYFVLEGRIPESLGNCTELKELGLQKNGFSGLRSSYEVVSGAFIIPSILF